MGIRNHALGCMYVSWIGLDWIGLGIRIIFQYEVWVCTIVWIRVMHSQSIFAQCTKVGLFAVVIVIAWFNKEATEGPKSKVDSL